MAFYIGLMLGTSVDAVDVALVDITDKGIYLQSAESYPLPQAVHQQLLHCSQHSQDNTPLADIAALDHHLAEIFAASILDLLAAHSLNSSDIVAIGNVGQTLYHAPLETPAYTWQLGDSAILAERTGINTVGDFRRCDMAAGGQGAPLTPAFHHAVFHSDTENRAIVNIGGIANITILNKAIPTCPEVGFDTGAGNCLIDAWCHQHTGAFYDKDGQWAKTGQVQPELLAKLCADSYFQLSPPKSTGRDYFNLSWLQHHATLVHFKPEDIQATLCQFTVDTIAQAIQNYAVDSVFVCGGGVHNPLIMNGLTAALANSTVKSTHALNIDPNWVEAISFAWFAHQRIQHLACDLQGITGARQPTILGCTYIA